MLPVADSAAVISATAAAITALGGLVLSFTVLLPLLRISRSSHKIINQQRTDMVNYTAALTRALREHGIEIPVDQSLPDATPNMDAPAPLAQAVKVQVVNPDPVDVRISEPREPGGSA